MAFNAASNDQTDMYNSACHLLKHKYINGVVTYVLIIYPIRNDENDTLKWKNVHISFLTPLK